MIKVSASPNIAFIKYWGKRESQHDETRNIGVNASISMTLAKAKSFVQIERLASNLEHEIRIDTQVASAADRKRILAHIARVERHFISEYPRGAGPLKIYSNNNFPASAGIASSASAYCALTIGICAAIMGKEKARNLMVHHPKVLSMLSRRGSGSAARSICGGFMYWDNTHAESIKSPWHLRDTIVILNKSPKLISSTEGHARALTSPHFAERLAKLPARTAAVREAILRQDFHRLGEHLEIEALEMHMIAETSVPPVRYLTPEARRLMQAIRAIPQRDFYFTIDAGPNLHLISEMPITQCVQSLLHDLQLEAEIWEDGLGTGPCLE